MSYGGGPSTGLDQTAAGKIATGFESRDVVMAPEDREILRRLAERVAEISQSEEMCRRRRLWHQTNTLQRTRPVVFCDPENGWNEIITESQMLCRGKLARRWEMDLRKEIFWGEEMGDDKPVEPYLVVPYTVRPDDWGLETVFHQPDMLYGAQSWEGGVQDYDRDLPKLHAPPVEIDAEVTEGTVALAEDVLSGILEVRLTGIWWWSLGITLPGVLLRGLTNMLMDFVDQPDNLKALFSRISQGHLEKLDYLEERGLLDLNNDGTYVGSGGFGFSDELPAADFSGKARCRDLWGFAESQETVRVSPQMYEEFVFPYEKPILERFGLNCYGCCEPLDARWETVKQHHNLRRVSCSPWADYEKMAEYLGGDYVFSMKPTPADLARPEVDWDRVRSELRQSLETTRDCVVEILMKDNHTISRRPENLTTWCRIAREEAERVSG